MPQMIKDLSELLGLEVNIHSSKASVALGTRLLLDLNIFLQLPDGSSVRVFKPRVSVPTADELPDTVTITDAYFKYSKSIREELTFSDLKSYYGNSQVKEAYINHFIRSYSDGQKSWLLPTLYVSFRLGGREWTAYATQWDAVPPKEWEIEAEKQVPDKDTVCATLEDALAAMNQIILADRGNNRTKRLYIACIGRPKGYDHDLSEETVLVRQSDTARFKTVVICRVKETDMEFFLQDVYSRGLKLIPNEAPL